MASYVLDCLGYAGGSIISSWGNDRALHISFTRCGDGK